MLNTAVFSARGNDKGLHFLPDKQIERLYLNEKESECDIKFVITLMHHHYEWFNEAIKLDLEKALFGGTSLLLLGHEHVSSSKSNVLNGEDEIKIVAGGILRDRKNNKRRSFNSILVDTDKGSVCVYKFRYSERNTYTALMEKSELPVKRYRNNRLCPSKEFLMEILEDTQNNLTRNLTEYYTFPRITLEGNGEFTETIKKTEICSINDFLELLYDKKNVIIKGEENTGKTALMQYLYWYLKNVKIPVLFSAENMKSKSVDKFVKDAFRNQYSEYDYDYAKFLEEDLCNKVALVDDIHLIKSVQCKNILKELRKHFGYIVITVKDEFDFDVYRTVRDELDPENNFVYYKINKFFADKRKELIGNVITAYSKHKCVSNDIDLSDDANRTVQDIHMALNKQMKLFSVNPNMIIQFTKYFIDNFLDNTTNSQSAFGMVFESNLFNSMRKVVPDTLVSTYGTVLEELSHYIHTNKQYPVKLAAVEKVIVAYNEEYDQKINACRFISELQEAKILKSVEDGQGIKFRSNNLLAYFLAKRINRQFNDDRDYKDLYDVLNNICFGINDSVVLFLSYITQNTKLLLSICDTAEKFTSDWIEFDLKKKNVRFLFERGVVSEVTEPKEEERKDITIVETESEKINDKRSVIETKDLYDYSEEDLELEINKLMKASKYVEVIAKALPNFQHVLKKDAKEKIIRSIYTIPNKIIYRILHDIDVNFDDFIDELARLFNENRTGEEISKEKIEKMFCTVSVCFILSMYNFYALEATDRNTVVPLSKYRESDNVNYMIENAMMYENLADVPNLSKLTDSILKEGNTVGNNMIQRVIRKCLIYNGLLNDAEKRSLRSKYFPRDKGKSILLSQLRNKY